MTTRPYELLARFAPDGTVAGVSVRNITTVDGRDYESDPMPLSDADDPAFVAFAESFAASAMAELESLRSLKAENETLKAHIAELEYVAPSNMRMLPPYSFLLRFTTGERIAIRRASNTDDVVGLIMDQVTTVRVVDLDLPETQQAVGYLASVGLIEPSRMSEILADAKPEEL
jgi:hypothetical protein